MLKKELGVPDDMAFARSSLKGFDRVIEKAINDYEGDVGRVIDVNGATFMLDNLENAKASYLKAVDILSDKIVKKKELVTTSGYKDFKINFKTSNGFIGELIILDEDTAWMKDEGVGHKTYEETRKLEPYLKKESYKKYQSLLGMEVWRGISKLNDSLNHSEGTLKSCP